MKKINIIKKSEDFNRIISKRQGISNKYFILNQEETKENTIKFGITFVKNIGNAVTRNKIKRQIKSIIDNNKDIYSYNNLYVVIARKKVLELTYQEMEKELISLFNDLKRRK